MSDTSPLNAPLLNEVKQSIRELLARHGMSNDGLEKLVIETQAIEEKYPIVNVGVGDIANLNDQRAIQDAMNALMRNPERQKGKTGTFSVGGAMMYGRPEFMFSVSARTVEDFVKGINAALPPTASKIAFDPGTSPNR